MARSCSDLTSHCTGGRGRKRGGSGICGCCSCRFEAVGRGEGEASLRSLGLDGALGLELVLRASMAAARGIFIFFDDFSRKAFLL